ncbi:MAG: hypothetical protein DSY46_07265 [Hydrogenimonas sp.]|nr:MAG: hypothetical protein DSY46_07265 [Hydrogenimonas sp.]
MCLILTILFIVLGIQAIIDHNWSFAALYGAITLFFIWLLVDNIKAVLIHKGQCSSSGCSIFDLLKRSKKKPNDKDLSDQ